MTYGSAFLPAFRRVRRRALFLCLMVFALPASAAEETLRVRTETGVRVFRVEVARTEAEQVRGLMFRESLSPDAGMLFDFGAEGHRSMWMRNTLIPLDMLFIDGGGAIVKIARNAAPESLESIRSGRPARAVLEINGGACDRLGIREGDRVELPAPAVD